jgi:uncharacterized protein YihD (DUF1040 family)
MNRMQEMINKLCANGYTKNEAIKLISAFSKAKSEVGGKGTLSDHIDQLIQVAKIYKEKHGESFKLVMP